MLEFLFVNSYVFISLLVNVLVLLAFGILFCVGLLFSIRSFIDAWFCYSFSGESHHPVYFVLGFPRLLLFLNRE